jgi:hypothetical protein
MDQVSGSTPQLFGQTEFELRDRCHALGAEVLEVAAEERVKRVIAGIGVMRRGLNAKCRKALYAVESRATPFICNCAAAQSSPGLSHYMHRGGP